MAERIVEKQITVQVPVTVCAVCGYEWMPTEFFEIKGRWMKRIGEPLNDFKYEPTLTYKPPFTRVPANSPDGLDLCRQCCDKAVEALTGAPNA